MSSIQLILLLTILVSTACNTPSSNNSFANTEVINTTPMVSDQQLKFNTFVSKFPDLTLPYTLNEQQLKALVPKATSISLNDAEQFICFKGNVYECVVSPEDSQTEEGIDIRKDFKIIGKVTSDNYILLVYLFDDEFGYYQAFSTTYTLKGQPISSKTICGLASSSNTLTCAIHYNKINLENTEYKYGHKNNPNKLVKVDKTTLNIDKNGKF